MTKFLTMEILDNKIEIQNRKKERKRKKKQKRSFTALFFLNLLRAHVNVKERSFTYRTDGISRNVFHIWPAVFTCTFCCCCCQLSGVKSVTSLFDTVFLLESMWQRREGEREIEKERAELKLSDTVLSVCVSVLYKSSG